MRSSRIWGIIKAEVCVICRSRSLNNSSYPTRTEYNNCFIIYLYLRTFCLKKYLYFEFWHKQHKPYVFCIWHKQHKLVWRHKVITPNLGYYRTDMTISSTALNQSKLLNYFQWIINLNISMASLAYLMLKNLRCCTTRCTSWHTIIQSRNNRPYA